MENLNGVGELYCLNKNDPLMVQVLDKVIWHLPSVNNRLILAENTYSVQAENTFVQTEKDEPSKSWHFIEWTYIKNTYFEKFLETNFQNFSFTFLSFCLITNFFFFVQLPL